MSSQLEQAIENGQPISPELLIQGAPVLFNVLDTIFGRRRRAMENEIATLKSAVLALSQINSMQDFMIKELQSDIAELKRRS